MLIKNRKRKKFLKRVFVFSGIFVFVILSTSIILSVSADVSEETAVKVLQTYPLEHNEEIKSCVRGIAWLIILGLSNILNALGAGLTFLMGNYSQLFSNEEVQNFIATIVPPVAFTLLGITIAVIGLTFIFTGKIRAEIVQNLIIGILVVVVLPVCLFGNGGDFKGLVGLTEAAVDGIGFNPGDVGLGDGFVQQNIRDNLLFDQTEYPTDEVPTLEESVDNISSIDINAVVHEADSSYKNIWNKQLDSTGEGLENIKTFEIPITKSEVDFLGKRYYRYRIDMLTVVIAEIVQIITLVLTMIKIARLMFELVIHQILADIFAFIDIQSGQRLKKCLQSILATFATVVICMLMFRLYIFGTKAISGWQQQNMIAYLLALLGLSWALIDGPNIVEQLIGIDAGLHSATRAIYGVKTFGHAVTGAAKTVGKVGKGNQQGAGGSGQGNQQVAGGSIQGNQQGEKIASKVSNSKASKSANEGSSHSMPGMSSPQEKSDTMQGSDEKDSGSVQGKQQGEKANSMPGMAGKSSANATQGSDGKAGDSTQGKQQGEKANSMPGMAGKDSANATQGSDGKAGGSVQDKQQGEKPNSIPGMAGKGSANATQGSDGKAGGSVQGKQQGEKPNSMPSMNSAQGKSGTVGQNKQSNKAGAMPGMASPEGRSFDSNTSSGSANSMPGMSSPQGSSDSIDTDSGVSNNTDYSADPMPDISPINSTTNSTPLSSDTVGTNTNSGGSTNRSKGSGNTVRSVNTPENQLRQRNNRIKRKPDNDDKKR